MPLLLVLLVLLAIVLSLSSTIGSGFSALIVEVDVERPPKEFFKGPKLVSLNSKTQY